MDEQLEEIVQKLSSLLHKMVYIIPLIGEKDKRVIECKKEGNRKWLKLKCDVLEYNWIIYSELELYSVNFQNKNAKVLFLFVS